MDDRASRRILLWSSGFGGEVGGIETLARAMVREMHGRGHRFEILTPNVLPQRPSRVQWEGVPVHGLPVHDAFERRDPEALASLRRRLEAIVENFAPDVLHLNHFHPALVVLLQSRLCRRLPLLYTAHGRMYVSAQGTGPDTVAGRVLRVADWVVGCAEASLVNARSIAPEIETRSSLIRNALPPDPEPVTALPFDPPVLLCIGRIVEQKGFDLALKAFAGVSKTFPTLRMVVAGEGPALETLRSLAENLGIAARTQFCGHVEPGSVRALLERSTIVVMPSRDQEGIPMVTLEAARQARPVVASDIPGLREAVADRRSGLLVPPDDPIALEAALGYLLRRPEQAGAFGREAKRRALAEFDWNTYVEEYAALYAQLARGKKRVEHN